MTEVFVLVRDGGVSQGFEPDEKYMQELPLGAT